MFCSVLFCVCSLFVSVRCFDLHTTTVCGVFSPVTVVCLPGVVNVRQRSRGVRALVAYLPAANTAMRALVWRCKVKYATHPVPVMSRMSPAARILTSVAINSPTFRTSYSCASSAITAFGTRFMCRAVLYGPVSFRLSYDVQVVWPCQAAM